MRLLITLIAFSSFVGYLHAKEDAKVSALQKEIQTSFEGHDLARMSELFDWTDVENIRLNKATLLWAVTLAQKPKSINITWAYKKDFTEKVVNKRIIGKFLIAGEAVHDGENYKYKHIIYASKSSKDEIKLVSITSG